MTFVVEEDEAFDPVDIGFLSPWAVMPGADCLADLVKEFGLGSIWGNFHNRSFPLAGAVLHLIVRYLDLGRSLFIQWSDL